jgi:hypothetical protein
MLPPERDSNRAHHHHRVREGAARQTRTTIIIRVSGLSRGWSAWLRLKASEPSPQGRPRPERNQAKPLENLSIPAMEVAMRGGVT